MVLQMQEALSMDEAFRLYHEKNPRIYEEFCKFAHQALSAGRKVGPNSVIERVRWETAVRAEGDRYKVNDKFTARYARKFIEDHPQYAGCFKTRKLRT